MADFWSRLGSAFSVDFPLSAALKLVLALVIGLGLHWLLRKVLGRFVRREFGRRLLARSLWPGRLAFAMLAVWMVTPALTAAPLLALWVAQAMAFCLVVLFGWIVIIALNSYFDLTSRHLNVEVEDNLAARKRLTQIRLLRRSASITVGFLTAAAAVMTLPGVRELGLSLFASAGVAGIVMGFAAQPVLSNLIAGVQIAITQPIRLDDAVVVEGEWGWIEDIRGTYVVIRIWDLRRLIVPISYFIQNPFQNWTRENANLIGSVFWYVDYSVPVGAVRARLEQLLQQNGKWDGKVASLQVTDVKQDTVELRGLMSATNSPRAWDLRCEIREQMLDWLQATYPEALPKQRTVFSSPDGPRVGPGELVSAPTGDDALRASAPAQQPKGVGQGD